MNILMNMMMKRSGILNLIDNINSKKLIFSNLIVINSLYVLGEDINDINKFINFLKTNNIELFVIENKILLSTKEGRLLKNIHLGEIEYISELLNRVNLIFTGKRNEVMFPSKMYKGTFKNNLEKVLIKYEEDEWIQLFCSKNMKCYFEYHCKTNIKNEKENILEQFNSYF